MNISPFLILVLTAVVSFITTIPTIFYAKKYDLVTDKTKRKHPAHTHTGIIPRAGGLPIFFALCVMSLFFIPISKILIGILIASFFLILLGLFDDYLDTSPYLRFIANLAICTFVVSFGLGIPYISNPFGGIFQLDQFKLTIGIFGTHSIILLADLLAVLWLTWTINMVNWSKGVDGQLPGFVAITAFFLGIIAQRFSGHDISTQSVQLFSFIVAGAFLGFLPFNFYPQKIMPGYGGGALAGFLLGIISILSFGKFGTAILILAIPLIDALYTIVRRIVKKKSPFRADWGHFHHKLLEIGWGKRRIAVFYWTISLMLGISSLFLKGTQTIIAFIAIAVILLVFIFIIGRIKISKI
jgi:UDP-GlcNAc:undecaprenyl-phosphate GlcNAc-1-phosphate transferase